MVFGTEGVGECLRVIAGWIEMGGGECWTNCTWGCDFPRLLCNDYWNNVRMDVVPWSLTQIGH